MGVERFGASDDTDRASDQGRRDGRKVALRNRCPFANPRCVLRLLNSSVATRGGRWSPVDDRGEDPTTRAYERGQPPVG